MLQGYVDTLKATCTKIEEQSSSGRVCAFSHTFYAALDVLMIHDQPTTKGRYLEAWRKAHQRALAAQNKLKQVGGDLTMSEESAAEGLKLLELR